MRWGRIVAVVVAGALLMLVAAPVPAHANLVWQAAGLADATDAIGLSGVACPAASQCTAVDGLGDEVTFNPANPGSPTPETVTPGGSATSIACPSTTLCVTAEQVGIVTFDPATPGAAHSVDVTGGLALVACPSVAQCTGVDSLGKAITFDPANPGSPTPTSIDANGEVTAIVCASTRQCTAVDKYGDEITFDPDDLGAATLKQIDMGTNPGGSQYGITILGLSCWSTQECTAVDFYGNEVSFMTSPESIVSSQPIPGDGGGPVADVACQSSSSCLAISSTNSVVSFSPATGSGSGSSPLASSLEPVALACASASQCTAVGSSGSEQTFAVSPFTAAPAAVIAHGGRPLGLACASRTECVAAAGSAATRVFDPLSPAGTAAPAGGVYTADGPPQVACPAANECVTADIAGNTQTFDPSAPGEPMKNSLGQGANDVACPATDQCTAVGGGSETTFNPVSFTVESTHTIDSGEYLESVACPSNTQCTAVDQSGNAVTFDPAAYTTQVVIDVNGSEELDAVACPSTTECIAVSDTTGAVRFDPIGSASPVPAPARPALNSVACVAANDCLIATDAGQVLEGDPGGAGQLTAESLPGANSVERVACPDAGECVAVDLIGRAFVGFETPLSTAPPGIVGGAQVGQQLTEIHGTWSVPVNSYSYQWEDCDSAGANCTGIPGATGQSYTVVSADAGHTIEVRETVANGAAVSAPAASPTTAVVPGAQVGTPPGSTGPTGATGSTGPRGSIGPGSAQPANQRVSIVSLATRGSTAKVTIACHEAAGRSCDGTLKLHTAVTPTGKTPARARKRRAAMSLLVASARYMVAASKARTYKVKLNAGGRRLMAHAYRLSATATLSGAPSVRRPARFVYGRIKVTLLYHYAPGPGATTSFQSLILQGLPRRGRLVVLCIGGGCPFVRRPVRYARTSISIEGLVHGTQLARSATLTFRVTAPARVGGLVTLTMQGANAPTETKQCLPPGARAPAACLS